MAVQRNGYLVSKALKNFMLASILAALAQQVATTTDAIVVSHLIGPDAISAVNLVTPVLSLCTCIGYLFGMGGAILAAKAMGRRDMETANRVFTASVAATLAIGLLLSIGGHLLAPQITRLLCPQDSRIYPLALSFLRTVILGIAFSLVGFTLQNFVKTDGNPRLVTAAVGVGTLLNFIFDILFIKCFGMGIAGSALATLVSYIVSVAVCLLHFRRPHHWLKLDLSFLRGNYSLLSFQSAIVREGFPMCINGLLLALSIYGFNSIVLHALGADGMYVWSVCLQLFLITQMVMAGIGGSLFSIGGLLAGERDMPGLSILFRRVMRYISAILIVFIAFIFLWPGAFGRLFGSSAIDVGSQLGTALRIFSLMLLPYAAVANLRVVYQIVGYRLISVVLSIAQLVVMVLFVWAFALLLPRQLWWGFPASALLLLLIVLAVAARMRRRQGDAAPVTLIPRSDESRALNISVKLTAHDVETALADVSDFLRQCNIHHTTAYNVHLCCDELLRNILSYAVGRHPDRHYADIHIRCADSGATVLIKDDGRPFDPTLKEIPGGIEHLGLRLVKGTGTAITYKYMYGQNMVHLSFPVEQQPATDNTP